MARALGVVMRPNNLFLIFSLGVTACGGPVAPPSSGPGSTPVSPMTDNSSPGPATDDRQSSPPEDCLATYCAAEAGACGEECMSLNDCARPCGDDDACWGSCFDTHSDASLNQLLAVLDCAAAHCSDDSAPSPGPSTAPSDSPAELSIYASCYDVGASAIYLAPCADTSYGENVLEISIGAREGIRFASLEPGCYDIWVVHTDRTEAGNSVTLRAGDSVTVGSCGGSEFDVALTSTFRSTTKGTLADTQVRVDILNRCSYHFCKVLRSPCGANQWERISLNGALSVPSDRRTTLEHLPDGCQDFEFVPCYEELHAGYTWSGTFTNGNTYGVELCAN